MRCALSSGADARKHSIPPGRHSTAPIRIPERLLTLLLGLAAHLPAGTCFRSRTDCRRALDASNRLDSLCCLGCAQKSRLCVLRQVELAIATQKRLPPRFMTRKMQVRSLSVKRITNPVMFDKLNNPLRDGEPCCLDVARQGTACTVAAAGGEWSH